MLLERALTWEQVVCSIHCISWCHLMVIRMTSEVIMIIVIAIAGMMMDKCR